MSAYKVSVCFLLDLQCFCKTSIHATDCPYFGVLPILQHYSWEGFANTSLSSIAGVLIVAFQHFPKQRSLIVPGQDKNSYGTQLSGWKRRGGGRARAQDQDHPHLQERQVSGEGLQRPHPRRQGQGAEGEGPGEDAHQGAQDHHQEDSLRRGIQDLGQVPDEDPQESD